MFVPYSNKTNRQDLLNTKLNSARPEKQGTAVLASWTGIRGLPNAEASPNLQTFMQSNQHTGRVLPPQQLVQPGVKCYHCLIAENNLKTFFINEKQKRKH